MLHDPEPPASSPVDGSGSVPCRHALIGTRESTTTSALWRATCDLCGLILAEAASFVDALRKAELERARLLGVAPRWE